MESYFGITLDGLEAYHAPELCEDLDANGLSIGNVVAFRDDAPSLSTVMHEVTHALQMGGHSSRISDGELGRSRLLTGNNAHEQQAHDLAGGHHAQPLQAISPGPRVVRLEDFKENRSAWSLADEEPGTAVDKPGRIGGKDLKPGDYKRLYEKPLPGVKSTLRLRYNARVWINKRNKAGWYHVTSGDGVSGWVQGPWVHVQPADSEATLHTVQSKEELRLLVAREYAGIPYLNQTRMMVEAVMWLNGKSNLGGVYKVEPKLNFGEKIRYAAMSASQKKTFMVWKSVRLRDNHPIWLPSLPFVRGLQKSGEVDKFGGSMKDRFMHNVASAVTTAWGWVKFGAGFLVGLVRGALESVYDLFKGAVDLIKMVGKVIRSLFTGQIAGDAKALWKQITSLDLKSLGKAFLNKWNNGDQWKKGMFRGRVVGYVIAEVLMMIFSVGVLTAVKWGGRFSKVSSLIGKSQKVQQIAQKLSKVQKLPGKAKDFLKKKFLPKKKAPDGPDVRQRDPDKTDGPGPIKGPRRVPDWSAAHKADDLIAGGSQVRGRFPKTSTPNSVLYRKTDGQLTHYHVYDAQGLPVKRVDLTGAAHAGVPTPHVVHYVENVAPGGKNFRGMEKTVRPAHPNEIPGARARLMGKKSGKGDGGLKAGEGWTDKFGNYSYSTRGTKTQQKLVKYHEQVHSLLSPKFKYLRTLRADMAIQAYQKSHLVRYIEEMLAELYAQLRVHGFKGIPDAIKFPVKNGYVSVTRIATEGAVATITVGGVMYMVHASVNK